MDLTQQELDAVQSAISVALIDLPDDNVRLRAELESAYTKLNHERSERQRKALLLLASNTGSDDH